MTGLAVLFRKEFKQNLIIYAVPFLVLILFWALQLRGVQPLPRQWLKVLGVVLPIALAFSYGLQAFDLEENGQTRDFLLTRPLSFRRIIGAKYGCGLAVLLVFSAVWPAVLVPAEIKWPDFANFPTFYYSMYLITVIILYTLSFAMGIFVKGPVKLVAALLAGGAGVVWFFYTGLELMTFSYYQLLGNWPDMLLYLLLFLATLGLLTLLVVLALKSGGQGLRNTAWRDDPQLIRITAVLLVIPLFGLTLNHLHPPAIKPFNSLAATLFGREKWFYPVEGRKQPLGPFYLFYSTDGRLGVARPGQKPRPIYRVPSLNPSISDLSWSPDGRKLAFKEGKQFRIGTIRANRFQPLYTIADVDTLLWSNDSQAVLTLKSAGAQPQADQAAARSIQLNRVQLATGQTAVAGSLRSNGIAHGWDADRNTLIALDPQWKIVLIDTVSKQVRMFNLLPEAGSKLPPLIFGQIIPPPAGSHRFQVAVISYPSGDRYALLLYELDTVGQTVRLRHIVKNVNYKDLVLGPDGAEAIARTGSGTYYPVRELSKAR